MSIFKSALDLSSAFPLHLAEDWTELWGGGQHKHGRGGNYIEAKFVVCLSEEITYNNFQGTRSCKSPIVVPKWLIKYVRLHWRLPPTIQRRKKSEKKRLETCQFNLLG